jgi:hypothetical protein
MLIWVCFVYINLKLLVAHLVSHFKLAVRPLVLPLDGVISKMYEPIAEIIDIVFETAGSNVAFIVNVSFGLSPDRSKHGIGSDVELSPVDQHGVVDVPLHDTGSLAIVVV